MTRTTRRKLAYFAVVAAGTAVVLSLYFATDRNLWTLIGLGLLLLIPSRIQGFYWRTFFQARRLMGSGDHERALELFQSFLARLRSRPSLKKAIWLNASIYTNDAEAMTLNNIGACKLRLGDPEGAVAALEEASGIDPESPLPYFNLALVAHTGGQNEVASTHLERARELGYRGATSDRLIHLGGSLLARVEGVGARKA